MTTCKRDWIPTVPLLGQLWKETPFVFMAAGENGVNPTLLMSQARPGWEADVEDSPSAAGAPGWTLRLPWNGHVTACSSATPIQGWLQFCLQQLYWLVCHICVPLDQLWNSPKPGASLSHKDILSLLPLVSVWWVNFLFASLCFFCFFCFYFVFCFFYHCVLQLLVYMRVVEFVCTLISSLLKCFWFSHFLVSLQKLLQQRSFLGWRQFIRCPPLPG